MIQRIQTLYLLVASVLMAAMLFFPLARVLGGDDVFEFRAFGVMNEGVPAAGYFIRTTAMGLVIALSAILPLVTIFLFRNRMLQIRLCYVCYVLMGGTIIFTVYYGLNLLQGIKEAYDSYSISYGFTLLFPVLSIIIVWLAMRGIIKDEALIRSVDRIR